VPEWRTTKDLVSSPLSFILGGNNVNLLISNNFNNFREKISGLGLDAGNLAGILLLHRLTDAGVSSGHRSREVSR
jgi:hypothetical protein